MGEMSGLLSKAAKGSRKKAKGLRSNAAVGYLNATEGADRLIATVVKMSLKRRILSTMR
jgi:hypothetical protein